MDTLRGLAVVGVILMHAELEVVSATERQFPAVHAINELLGPVRMPLLVFLSGLLLPRSLAKGLRTHLRGKATHILWPYAVWSLLDVAHVQVDALIGGNPQRWELLPQLLYDPHTYLWFLGYLFVFHVAAALVPSWGRTLAVPAAFLLTVVLPVGESVHKLVFLFGFFLLGDLAARELAGRVAAPMVDAAEHLHVAPLAAIGRESLVFYACHLLVLTYAVRSLAAVGLTDPRLLLVTGVAAALSAGVALAHVRRSNAGAWLFAWPGGHLGKTGTRLEDRRVPVP